jgi:uncharacterized protein (DUF1501 family)
MAMTERQGNSAEDARLMQAACEGCAESRLLLSRRAVLGVTAGLFSWACMPRFAHGAGSTDPRLLIVVLRGGMDGLNVCVPFGDTNYAPMRGSIAIPAASTIKLNSFFGLHPTLINFGNLYKAGDAAVVHAASIPLRSRSHFDAQDNLENGMGNVIAPTATGWLNRLLMALPAGDPVRMAGGIQIGEAPLIMRGPAPVLGWSATKYLSVLDPTLSQVRAVQARDAEMYDALQRGLAANQLAAPLEQDDGEISTLRKSFRGAGRLFAADGGPRIAVISANQFDTHANQGGTRGVLADLLSDLDKGIGDFKLNVGSAWSRTAILLATEFGRNVRINGGKGTDHGVGTVALLAGGAVQGGKVICDWPGLAPSQLFEGDDLKPTIDLRAVFKGVLRDHLGVSATTLGTSVFPGSTGVSPLANLIKTSAPDAASSAPSIVSVRPSSAIGNYRRTSSTAN